MRRCKANAANIAELLPRIEQHVGRRITDITVVAEPFHGPRAIRLFNVTPQFDGKTFKFSPTERAPLHPLQERAYGSFQTPAMGHLMAKGVIGRDAAMALERLVDKKRKMILGW